MTARALEAQVRREAARSWWLWLVTGILWVLISIFILQFDEASAATVGIIAGIMFIAAGVQYFFVGTMVEGWRWLWFVIGGFLVVGGFVALLYPTRTFASIATILGFVVALIGVTWIVEAFAIRSYDDFWWLNFVAGILMLIMGIWLGGQYFFTQAATLLVFVGIWAMMRGVLDITAAFTIKSIAD